MTKVTVFTSVALPASIEPSYSFCLYWVEFHLAPSIILCRTVCLYFLWITVFPFIELHNSVCFSLAMLCCLFFLKQVPLSASLVTWKCVSSSLAMLQGLLSTSEVTVSAILEPCYGFFLQWRLRFVTCWENLNVLSYLTKILYLCQVTVTSMPLHNQVIG